MIVRAYDDDHACLSHYSHNLQVGNHRLEEGLLKSLNSHLIDLSRYYFPDSYCFPNLYYFLLKEVELQGLEEEEE